MSKKACNCRIDSIEVVEINVGAKGLQGVKGEKGDTGEPGIPGVHMPHQHDVSDIIGLTEVLNNLNPFARIEVLDNDPVNPEAGRIWILRGGSNG